MKKIKFLILLIFASFLFCATMNAQNYQKRAPQEIQQFVPDQNTVLIMNITLNQIRNGWAHWGAVCSGCPAYYYQILRSKTKIQAEDGIFYYYYYFNFYSDSFYTNGAQSSTYLTDINYYFNGIFMLNIQYLLLSPGQAVWGSWMRSQTENASVSFTVTNVSVY